MKTFDYLQYKELTWDNDLLSYVSQIHELKGKLSNFELNYKANIDKLAEFTMIQSTESSNRIEGIMTTASRMKQILNNKEIPKNRDEDEILGYRDCINIINENHEFIQIKSSYILQLHDYLYKYSNNPNRGKFKNIQNYINEARGDGTSFIRFVPLDPFETPSAIDNLCNEFNIALSKNYTDPLILISIFILDFLCIHPFNDGNGRLSRLLTHLLLLKNGYIVGKYISIEKIIEETKDNYYYALQASSIDWINNKNNPLEFIKYMLSIVLKAYRDLDTKADILFSKKSKALDKVQETIQTIIGKFTKSDIVELCPTLSETTIERCLKELLDKGIITKHGDHKSTFYTRND